MRILYLCLIAIALAGCANRVHFSTPPVKIQLTTNAVPVFLEP